MMQTIKTIMLSCGSIARLEYERGVEVLPYQALGSQYPRYTVGRTREKFQVVVDFRQFTQPFSVDLFVYHDSNEIWRKPIAHCTGMPKDIYPLLSDFHVEEFEYFTGSMIDRMCDQATRRLGFWIEDRVDFELLKMKSVLQ